MPDPRALLLATLAGTALQVAMVLGGHTNPAIKSAFAVGGMAISLAAGAACALAGIGVSYALGDVPARLLLLGTASSAATGALGGWVGRRRAASPATA